MAVFIDESTSSYDKEERLIFFAENESGLKAAHVVFSGNVFMSNTELRGDNDNVHNNIDVEMMVGPLWASVKDVVPLVCVSGFENLDADEDDKQRWSLRNLRWVTTKNPSGQERIQLRFRATLMGENSFIIGLSYYVTATGVGRGQD